MFETKIPDCTVATSRMAAVSFESPTPIEVGSKSLFLLLGMAPGPTFTNPAGGVCNPIKSFSPKS